MEVKVHMKVIVPKVPNFIHVSGIEQTISIGEFTDDELREIAGAWCLDLLARAAEIRNAKGKTP